MIGLRKALIQHVGFTLAGTLILVAVLSGAGMKPRPLWFVATALALGVGTLALRLLAPVVVETNWPGRYDEKLARLRGRWSDNRTQFLATWILESDRERQAGAGSRSYVRRIQPMLLELATDRLVHRHSIDPELEPERAKEFLGPRLWELLTTRQTASLPEIEHAIKTIEGL